MKAIKIIGTVFAGIGLVFIMVGIILYQDTRSFITKSETAMGEIVDLSRRSSSSGDSGSSSTYYPVVQFE